MAYIKTDWKDRVVENPNQYKDQNGVIYTFTRDNGTVIEEGTLITASIMNKLENKIYDLDAEDLTQYKRIVVTEDTNGIVTEVNYRRDDNTLFLNRKYYNPDLDNRYQTCIEKIYAENGTTLLKTITYTFTYRESGGFNTVERIVV